MWRCMTESIATAEPVHQTIIKNAYKGVATMKKELPINVHDSNQEKMTSTEAMAETPCQGILNATDIKIEEVSIDGICGVY